MMRGLRRYLLIGAMFLGVGGLAPALLVRGQRCGAKCQATAEH